MMTTQTTYRAYGMSIASDFPLEDLPEVKGAPDATVREGVVSDPLVESVMARARSFINPGVEFRFSPRAMYAKWDKVGKVLVRNGNDVIVEREAGATYEDVGPFLTGPVLAALLHQRGYFVLHASCVSINGVAAVFVGPKGHGKSTLAAHLRARGHTLISDDIVPLVAKDGEIWIEPGFPRIKLHDDSIEAMGADPNDYPTIHRFATKRSFQMKDTCGETSLPLHALYILHESAGFRIMKLSGADAFIEIMKNAHLGPFLAETEAQASYFRFCREITRTVPVFRLDRPHSFAEMPDIIAALETHASEVASANASPVTLQTS